MDPAVYYWDYLQLERLLSMPAPRERGAGRAPTTRCCSSSSTRPSSCGSSRSSTSSTRVMAIMGRDARRREGHRPRGPRAASASTRSSGCCIDQLGVLETMTPLDFLDFRDDLVPGSGFQCVQFRLIENRLGLTPRHRLKIKGAAYTDVLSARARAACCEDAEAQPSLLDHVERWLERTPVRALRRLRLLARRTAAAVERDARRATGASSRRTRTSTTRSAPCSSRSFDDMAATFEALFDRDRWEELRGRRAAAGCRTRRSSRRCSSTSTATSRSSPCRSASSPGWSTSTRGSRPGASATR